jgi:hypothetical protein
MAGSFHDHHDWSLPIAGRFHYFFATDARKSRRNKSIPLICVSVANYFYSASSSVINLIESSESTIKRSLYSEPMVFLKALLLIWKR